MSIERGHDAAAGDPFAFDADDVVGAAGNPGPALGSGERNSLVNVAD